MTPELVIRDTTIQTASLDERWRRVREYLQKNFSNGLTAREVARVAALEVNYFSRRFANVFGTNFVCYLRNLRLASVTQLLATTELPIDHIAYLSGFHDRRNFFRTFKQTYKMTPLQYRTHHTFRP